MTAAVARKPKPGPLPPRVIGHRGAAALAPENTLAGFRKAAESGVRWVEFDVHLTADGVPVLLHDDTLERTTDGRGPVAGRSLGELRRLDAGTWFGAAFRGERVPTLEETIALLSVLGLGAVVEIKPSPGAEAATAEATVRLLLERWPGHLPPLLVSSFKRDALAQARMAAPTIARALLVRDIPADWRAQVDALGCSAVHASERRLDAAVVAEIGTIGLPVFAYTVNEVERARELLGWGVKSIFSDRPHELARSLEGVPL